MRRREFIRHFSSTVVAWPLTARAAARPVAAGRRAYGLCGERFNRAVLARNIPGCAREVGVDGRQQRRQRPRSGPQADTNHDA
jgi:hypothetical protein